MGMPFGLTYFGISPISDALSSSGAATKPAQFFLTTVQILHMVYTSSL